MVSVRSLGLSGISGYEVTVECFLSGGLPAFDVVGLPDAAVRELSGGTDIAVDNLTEDQVIFAIGNIAGGGRELMEYVRREGSALV